MNLQLSGPTPAWLALDLQEYEGEQNTHDNHSCQHGGENRGDDDNGECDEETKLQEGVHVERKHRVQLLLIFGKAVENSSSRRRVKETHRAGKNLGRKETTFSLLTEEQIDWSWSLLSPDFPQYLSEHAVMEFAGSSECDMSVKKALDNSKDQRDEDHHSINHLVEVQAGILGDVTVRCCISRVRRWIGLNKRKYKDIRGAMTRNRFNWNGIRPEDT